MFNDLKIEFMIFLADVYHWWNGIDSEKKEFYEVMGIGVVIMVGFLLWIVKGY